MARLQLSSPSDPLAFIALTSGRRHLGGSQLVLWALGPNSGSSNFGACAPGAPGAEHLSSPAPPLFSLFFSFFGDKSLTI